MDVEKKKKKRRKKNKNKKPRTLYTRVMVMFRLLVNDLYEWTPPRQIHVYCLMSLAKKYPFTVIQSFFDLLLG